MDDPFFRRFFGDNGPFGRQRDRVQNALGSGVIVDASGIIVTNYHVIKDAEQVRVVLADRREFEAHILRTDQRADLAVLKIEVPGETLPTLALGDSDALEVGDLVLAIGNPFGVGQTVTSGIISGLARTAVDIGDFRSFIQTDAAINPGNSGGALVDLDGRLVGLNTAIFSESGGSVGIGFAIPAAMVRSELQGAISGKPIIRPWLGASGQAVTSEIAQGLGLTRPLGVLIRDVTANSPAAQAGIKIGDVMLSIDGHDIADPEELRFRVATLPLNASAPLVLWRAGQQREVTALLGPPPEQPPRDPAELTGHHPLGGATVANLNPAFSEELGLATAQHGVVVTKVKRGSVAESIGITTGDVIASINRHSVESVTQLQQLLSHASGPWTLSVQRNGELLTVTIGG
jgi:serine protease Do